MIKVRIETGYTAEGTRNHIFIIKDSIIRLNSVRQLEQLEQIIHTYLALEMVDKVVESSI